MPPAAPLIAAVPSLRDFYKDFDKISANTPASYPTQGIVAAETAKAVRAVHERVKGTLTNILPSAFAAYVKTPVGSMQEKLRDASIPFRREPNLLPTDRARLLSVMARGASAWNQAIPSVPQLTFSNELYQTAVYQMLGQPLPVLENMRQCLCGGDVDVYCNHFTSKA